MSFEIRLREKPAQETGTASAPPGVRVMKASYDAPAAGGPVRQALLGHFGDAARRSFITPRPAVLEGELVRFVSEILRHQSEFLSHVYAMRRFLNHVDPEQLAAADQPTAQRFRDVVKFHLRALDEREAAIYDGLSETLPRKFWTYRGDDRRSPETANWRDESTALLRDSLQFDSRLSALFGSTAVPVNMEDLDLSCGELLQRIRTHIRRIKSQTQAL